MVLPFSHFELRTICIGIGPQILQTLAKVKGGFELFIQHLAYVEPIESAGPPQWKNRFFVDGGMATFRSGWDQDDRVLILMGENGAAERPSMIMPMAPLLSWQHTVNCCSPTRATTSPMTF